MEQLNAEKPQIPNQLADFVKADSHKLQETYKSRNYPQKMIKLQLCFNSNIIRAKSLLVSKEKLHDDDDARRLTKEISNLKKSTTLTQLFN